MTPDPTGPVLILLILLTIEGWCAAAEEALRTASEARLTREAEEEGDQAAAARVLAMGEKQTAYVTALRLCARLAGLLACAAAVTLLAVPLCGGRPVLASAICAAALTLVSAVAADEVPRMLAARHPEETAKRTAGLLKAAGAVLRPLTWAVNGVASGVLRLFGVRPDDMPEEVTEDDIRLMVETGGETGAIEEGEKEMIENIFEFNNRSAEDVMTHRTDVTAIWVDSTPEEVLHVILDTGYSRFPVYGEDIDDILGVLNTRDFLLSSRDGAPKTLRALLREPYFVPEHVQADALFRDMQKRKVHMAVVVDEYGGMSGIVTMEDLLEEIVGNIYDETDLQTEAEITQLAADLWRISGATSLEDVSEALGIDLPTEEDYDTLGGLIYSQLTTIPQDGSHPEVDAAGLHIRVERLAEHRVETALVSIIHAEEGEQKGEHDHE